MKQIVIAIDGPAASGKSTTARLVAERLGYTHIDTGAMYRAMTLKVMEHHLVLDDKEGIKGLLDTTRIELRRESSEMTVFLDGRDVTQKIRTPEITGAVSVVSEIREVREAMVREQRRMAEAGGVVLEGRDIGTVVFPGAELKVYMVADAVARSKRRQNELQQHGLNVGLEKLVEEIRARDEKDSTRAESPLKRAEDAFEVDTSRLTIEEQVEIVVRKAQAVI
ncbi:MAG: (d)CMP kinase, partial [Bacteroidota bacterium]